jgi:uncharacterized membrane protein
MGEEVHKDQVDHHNNSERRRQFFKSFEAKSLKSRSFLTQVADDLTEAFSSTTFLFLNAIFFTAWIILNAGWIPQLPAFDPFPYGLLTMAVSLEAIFLSIFVLVSQNRSSYISSIREEVHLRVNLIAEEEITKVLEVLAEIRKEMGIKKHDEELEEMLRRIDTNYIERSILDQINRAKPSLGQELANKFPDILKTPITHLTHNGDSQKSSK